ncbi:MAG: formyltransferase family protein [Candidatus Gracilibacteria bacterium]|nr:formyltransferase family protein [Candidatus Gracilibacteria bacterium]
MIYKVKENLRIGLFGSGEGTGIEALLKKVKSGDINAQVAIIVSNNTNGSIENKVTDLGFGELFHLSTDFPDGDPHSDDLITTLEFIRFYDDIIKENKLDYIFLSGWLKYVIGTSERTTVNIHPGPTKPPYGGIGMYGDKLHQKIWEDYTTGKINQTCVTMHYVTEKVDDGPIIVQVPVSLAGCLSPQDVKTKVNAVEHDVQWKVTQLIVTGKIVWDGKDTRNVILLDSQSVDELDFPVGTVFAGEVDLKDDLPYNK